MTSFDCWCTGLGEVSHPSGEITFCVRHFKLASYDKAVETRRKIFWEGPYAAIESQRSGDGS